MLRATVIYMIVPVGLSIQRATVALGIYATTYACLRRHTYAQEDTHVLKMRMHISSSSFDIQRYICTGEICMQTYETNDISRMHACACVVFYDPQA